MNNWIHEWIWEKSAAWRSRTIIAFPEGRSDQLFGYGSWQHLDRVSETGNPATHIAIAWFGVHFSFHGERTGGGQSCAAALYSAVEHDALLHAASTPEMPLTLECHVENERGRCFWLRRGYRDLQEVELAEPGQPVTRYQRMVR